MRKTLKLIFILLLCFILFLPTSGQVKESPQSRILITEVLQGSLVDRAGIKPENIILEVNRETVCHLKDFALCVQTKLGKKQPFVLTIEKGDRKFFALADPKNGKEQSLGIKVTSSDVPVILVSQQFFCMPDKWKFHYQEESTGPAEFPCSLAPIHCQRLGVIDGFITFYFNDGFVLNCTKNFRLLKAYYNPSPKNLLHFIRNLGNRESIFTGSASKEVQKRLELMEEYVIRNFDDLLSQIFNLKENSSTVLALRALFYKEADKKEEFYKYAQEAYSLNQKDVWAKSVMAAMFIDKEKYDEALKILSTIRDSSFGKTLEAIVYAKLGNLEKAVSIYTELPENYLLTKRKFSQNYISSLQNLLKSYKDSKLKVAKELEKKGQHKEAIKEYEEYLKLADEKEAKEVRVHIAELIMKYPQHFALSEDARKTVIKAEVYTSEGKFEEALKEYKEALKKSPFFPALYKALALIFAQLKDYKQAIKNMNIYLDLYPDAPDIRTAKDEIYRWEFLMEKGK